MSAAQATGTATDPATTSTTALLSAAATATTPPAHRATKDTAVSTPIIDNNALTASLRALKLSGMLQTLDARLAQARAGELGHLEFLQVLCHDEISRRETTAIHRRTRRARFEQTLTDCCPRRWRCGEEDIMWMAVLVRQYADLKLGGTDAAVIATAERLGITRVATVDRRHFTVVRPRHVRSFALLPDPL